MKMLSGTKIDFISKRNLYFIISGAMIIAGGLSLILRGGPLVGIDFAGGHLFQINLSRPVEMTLLRRTLSEAVASFEIQNVVGSGDVLIRVRESAVDTQEIMTSIEQKVNEKLPDIHIRWDRVEYVGPVVGQHLFRQAFYAIIFSLIGIVVYVAFRFKAFIWGASGVVALAHDVFIVVGFFSILNREITLTVIAALLAIAGYSINDTIVIFDRIREKIKLTPKEDIGKVINSSINDTLSRTAITSLTTLLAVIALYFFGGSVLHDFAFALLLGMVAGTYSTICIAAPIVYEWQTRKLKERKA